MPIPDYQTLMLPLLEAVKDSNQYKISEVRELLALKFELSPEERRELLPSGTQPVFDNRVAWAKTYLVKAKLLDSPKRAHIQISDRGKKVLSKNPEVIDNSFLKQFPEFIEFTSSNNKEKGNSDTKETIITDLDDDNQTPREKLDNAFIDLTQKLAIELLDYVKDIDPYKFEILVLDLLQAMGYGGNREEAAQVTKKSGDGGIDGIINEDRLGLDKIYVQAKKWEGNVTISAIRDFGGTLLAHSAQKGIFITTSDFPKSAIDYCEKIDRTIILINGKRLTELMIEYNVGISPKKTYVVKVVDSDYFED
ncbi:restriction endonuclease [uncultured Draconibacterium sp.]|uniref:restriction endonuclease n=1 Tax=uncultured Draconibacterium sp. TaxID=1573823 RepID=UPI002AA7A00A|nr:restriction endonuclease [uncultured Draconibacterium sp.]